MSSLGPDIDPNPIDQVAKSAFGIDYLFPFQRLVISNIIEGKDQIVILPTGAGKSLCFSVPAAFLDGPTLIIFPLLALMSDQARRLNDTGLGVKILRGGQSRNERDAIFKACVKAKIPAWGPNRLRHNAATFLRKEFGIEAARVILGHTSAAVTEIYAEMDRQKAAEIMGIVG